MAESVAKGSWVEIHRIMLAAGKRAPHIPEDTSQAPLEMRVKGFLTRSAIVGGEAEIVTAAGRHLRGTLAEVNPAYSHSFGPPIPALLPIGVEVRSILRKGGESRS